MADKKLSIVLELVDKVSKEMNKVSKGFAKSVKNMKGYYVAVAAFAAVAVSGIMKAVDAYQVQEMAEMRLEHLTRQLTGATEEQIQALKDQASALQQIGVIGDEVTISAQSELATFGMQTDAIRMLTPAILDTIVAKQGLNATTESAIALTGTIGKAYTQSAAALSRMNITLSDTQSAAYDASEGMERVEILTEILEDNYGGLNEAMRETTAGGMQAFSNALGDITEYIGGAFSPALNEISNGLLSVGSTSGGVAKYITATFGKFLWQMVVSAEILLTSLYGVVRVIAQAILGGIKVAALGAQKMMSVILKGIGKVMNKIADVAGAAGLDGIAGKFRNNIGDMQIVTLDFGDIVGSTMAGMASGIEATSNSVNGLMRKEFEMGGVAATAGEKMVDSSNAVGDAMGGAAGKAGELAKESTDAFQKLDDILNDTADNIDDINASIEELKIGKINDMNKELTDLAGAFIDAEESISDLQKQMQGVTDPNERRDLQEQLEKELQVLSESAHMQELVASQIDAEKEERAKTDLERALDKFSEEGMLIDEKFQQEMAVLEGKLSEEQKVFDFVSSLKAKGLEVTKSAAKAEAQATIVSINAQIEAYNALARAADNARAGKQTTGVDIENINKLLDDIKIPALADGGIVNKPTLALIGEAGAEAVVPLSKMGGMGGGSTININWTGAVDERSADMVAQQVARVLDMEGRSSISMGMA